MARKFHQSVTRDIIDEVRLLLAGSTFASLAVLDPDGQYPAVSRVSMAFVDGFGLMILISALSPHTGALMVNPFCSLLIGKIGDGDPMAQSRTTFFCRATPVEKQVQEDIRSGYLERNPKAINYIDLPDFAFWNLQVERASYIAGFGRAYRISGQQLFGFQGQF